jgi:hypothetical protein
MHVHLGGPKTCKSLGPMQAVWLVIGYGMTTGRLYCSISTVMFARPSSFSLVKPFKKHLGGKEFVTRRREASCLLTTKLGYTLVPQKAKCFNVNGNNVEVLCILFENHMPQTHRSYNKVLGIRLPFALFFEIPFYNRNICLSKTSFIV